MFLLYNVLHSSLYTALFIMHMDVVTVDLSLPLASTLAQMHCQQLSLDDVDLIYKMHCAADIMFGIEFVIRENG